MRSRTKLETLSFLPEISLHLAHELVPLWHDTEIFRIGEAPPPYWAFAWAGGQALARYVLDNPAEFSGRTILDFGAGSGLVAIAAAKSGAQVYAADIDPLSAAAIKLNAANNGTTVEVLSHDLLSSPGPWDIILVGDMCYERPLAERLMEWLTKMAANGSKILVGDPGRTYFSAQSFVGVATYSVPTPLELEDRTIRETSVYLWDTKSRG